MSTPNPTLAILEGVERKLATVTFADLVGSTALVAGADPEVVHRRVTQFFDRVSHSIEAHGGTVELAAAGRTPARPGAGARRAPAPRQEVPGRPQHSPIAPQMSRPDALGRGLPAESGT